MTLLGRSHSRAAVQLVLAAVLALLGLGLLAGPAAAHATLVSSDPSEGAVLAAAPTEVVFTFDEPVRATDGSVRFFDATGAELDTDGRTSDNRLIVEVPSGLADGTYIVAWRVVSTDGHPIGGALTFSIGTPSAKVAAIATDPVSSPASVTAALGIVQAGTYLGVFGAAGLVTFMILLLPREKGIDQVRQRLLALATGFGWLSVLAGAFTLILTTLYQRGQGFAALFGDEPFEIPAGSELIGYLLAVLGVGVALVAARRAEAAPVAGGLQARLALAGAAGALLSLGLVGHTRAFQPFWLMLTSDLVHVAAGAAWFGGLIGLALSLRRLTDRPRTAALVLSRFSTLAGWLLLGVAATGSVLGWRILGSWENVLETDFGRVLMAKVALVALVAAVAGWNRFRLLPAVLADAGFAERGAAAARMQRAVRVEAVLLVAVLGLTGFLVDRTPVPDQGAVTLPGGFDSSTFTGQFDEVRVVAVVEPAGVGSNQVLLQVQDLAGNPIEPVVPPTLGVAEGDLALGEQRITNVDSGTYRATVLIPRPGTWSFTVSVPLSDFDNPVVTVEVPVG